MRWQVEPSKCPTAPPPRVLPLVEMMVPFVKMMTSVLENYNDLSQFIW